MDHYCPHPTPYRPAAGEAYLDWFGAPDLSSRSLPCSEVEEYYRRKARHIQEANNRRWGVHTMLNGPFNAPFQNTVPVAKVENGHHNIHRQPPGEGSQNLQQYPRPNSLNLASYGQPQSLGMTNERREYLRYEPAEDPRTLAGVGIGAQQYCNEQAMPQRALLLPTPPQPSDYPMPQGLWNARVQQEAEQRRLFQQRMDEQKREHEKAQQEAEQRRLAQQRLDEQKREHEKAQLPAAKPGNSYPRPSRISGPVRASHDDDMERRRMSNRTFATHPKSSEACRKVYRNLENKTRNKKEECCQCAMSVPTPEPTRTESVKHLLSSVNKALEQKVEAAELETADTDCFEFEAPQAQSQPLQQEQADAKQAARQCGESFWHEYSANYPTTKSSSMTTQWSQNSDSASAQPLTAESGRSKGEDDLADRPRTRPRRSQLEHSREKSASRPGTETIKKMLSALLKSSETASGQDDPSPPNAPVVSTSRCNEKCAADDPRVPLASHKDPSIRKSEKQVSSLPTPQGKENNVSLEVRAKDRNVENARGSGPLGALDIESGWEEVDDDVADEGWSHVEDDGGNEWASDVGSEGGFEC